MGKEWETFGFSKEKFSAAAQCLLLNLEDLLKCHSGLLLALNGAIGVDCKILQSRVLWDQDVGLIEFRQSCLTD